MTPNWPFPPETEDDWWLFGAIAFLALLFILGSSCEVRIHVESRPSPEVHP